MSTPGELAAKQATKSAFTREDILIGRTPTPAHPKGRPVSRSTYVNHGCRCDGCTDANTNATRVRRGQEPFVRLHPHVRKARQGERRNRENTARYRALTTLAERHGDEYRWLLSEARLSVDLERGPLPGGQP